MSRIGSLQTAIYDLVDIYIDSHLALIEAESCEYSGLVRMNQLSNTIYMPLFDRHWLSFKDDCYQETVFVLRVAIERLSTLVFEPSYQTRLRLATSKQIRDRTTMKRTAESSVIAGHSRAVFHSEPGLLAAIHCDSIPSTLGPAYVLQEVLFGLRFLPERMNGEFVMHAMDHHRRGEGECRCFTGQAADGEPAIL